jgi:hypothetical protein
MTDADKLEFLDHWMIDLGQVVRELHTAIQRLYERLSREMPDRQPPTLD